MIVTFCTLAGKRISIDLDESTPISKVKEILKNQYEIAGTIKLLYKGKPLKDEELISNIKYDPTGFVVIYAQNTQQKEKPAPAPKSTPQPSQPTPAPAAEARPTATMQPPQPAQSRTPFTGFQGQPLQRSALSKMRLNQPVNPHFATSRNEEALRQLFLQQPQAMINTFLSSIQMSNPALAQQISQNIEPFLMMMGVPATINGNQLRIQQSGAPGGVEGQLQQLLARFSPAEQDAIKRLCSMGYDPITVIQAYEACDKNELMTANLLASMGE